MELSDFVFVLEILGTIAFAVSGVVVARDRKMDVFGAVVLGCTTAVGGGIIRDLILGITPPTMFQKPVYVATAAAASLAVFTFGYCTQRLPGGEKTDLVLNIADTAGLAAFVAVGTRTAFEAGYAGNIFLCAFVGTVTGIGGGIIRDMMAGQTPLILRRHVYGLAAVAGALTYCAASRLAYGYIIDSMACIAVTCLIRYLAIHYHWNLPAFR